MSQVYLALGSNLGNKNENLERAISLLSEKVGEIISVSSFYRSEPCGFDSENDFLNAVVLVKTVLDVNSLLVQTQEIEKEMGRKAKSVESYADRIIDIDILFYNDLVLKTAELKIPHPLLQERDFVLIPLLEIASDFVHPVFQKSIKEL